MSLKESRESGREGYKIGHLLFWNTLLGIQGVKVLSINSL